MSRSAVVESVFRGVGLAAALILAALASPARGSLVDIFSNELAGLELEPLGPALANTVASTYPVSSASSSVTYVYNPKLETFERRTGVLGPLIGERSETIGKGMFDVAVSYSYVNLSSVNGESLSSLINLPEVNSRVVSFPVPGGVTLKNGRFTTFLPVLADVSLDVEANIFAPSITYGITEDLDVNLTVPMIYTFLGAKVKETIPDPRHPEFMLQPNDPNNQVRYRNAYGNAWGVGDVLLRGKYLIHRGEPVDVAGFLGVSFPSGNPDNLAGTGNYLVQPALIVSRVFLDRIEPFVNLGVNINANSLSASAFQWAVGATGQIISQLNGAVVFLGRNEFGAQTDPIEPPFFFQIGRNDIYDVSVGLRWLFAGSAVVSANAIVPLNNDGLRADVIPTFAMEYSW